MTIAGRDRMTTSTKRLKPDIDPRTLSADVGHEGGDRLRYVGPRAQELA
jgi:hypothetical protein